VKTLWAKNETDKIGPPFT